MDKENQSENQSAFSIKSTAMIFGALKPKQQKQNYIRNVFSTGFCFMTSRPIPGNPNMRSLKRVVNEYKYSDRLHIYRYILTVLRLLHMVGMYPSRMFPLHSQIFVYTNVNGSVEPLYVSKGFSQCMPSDANELKQLQDILGISIAVPQSYRDVVCPQAMQLLSKADLNDQDASLMSLNSIIAIANTRSEMINTVHAYPGKLIINRVGTIARPYDLMRHMARINAKSNNEAGKVDIFSTFQLILLYFHMQKQIETYKFLPDELQLYLYTPVDNIQENSADEEYVSSNTYQTNFKLVSNVIRPWNAIELSQDGTTSLQLPSYFVDHINSIGTELTPMEILRLVLGLSEFPTIYLINDFMFDDNSIKLKDQFIHSLSFLPEYYVCAFMQAVYAAYKVQYGDTNIQIYFDEAILLYMFTQESARKFVDLVK